MIQKHTHHNVKVNPHQIRQGLSVLDTKGKIWISAFRDLHGLIRRPNVPGKIRLKIRLKMPIIANFRKQRSFFSIWAPSKQLWELHPCHVGWFWQAALLSSSHLENLIIYTSAPLDAVPVNRLQVWMKPDQSRPWAGDKDWNTEKKVIKEQQKEREICLCCKWGKGK